MSQRPVLPDREAWLRLVGALQTLVRGERQGMAIITLRLAVKDGLLVAWAEPTIQRLHSDAASWLAGQGMRTQEGDQ